MNESDLNYSKSMVLELEDECVKKQNKINDLEKKIEIMEGCESIAKSGLFKDPLQAYIDTLMNVKDVEISTLRQKISELESELSVKENLPKIKNGLCGDNDLSGLTPIEVAEKLINAESEYETNSIERALGAGEKRKYDIFSVSDLRQIAEHLLVYCNHNLQGEDS